MKKNIKELREKYISNPPEGMTSEDIRHMSEDDLLDMDYFLNEDVFGDDFGEEGFIFSKTMIIYFALPTFMWAIFLWKGAKGELSYKIRKDHDSLELPDHQGHSLF